MNIDRPVLITVCADGFVSIMRDKKDRRLRAALPCHSTNTVEEAIHLIGKVCNLRACAHGGKTGTLIEPWAPNWPIYGEGTFEHKEELSKLFETAEEELE